MNISESEELWKLAAKTCGLLSAELEGCERLLKQTKDEIDKKIIETEIAELKMTLDLMP
jgi:hypothetical protein